MTVLWAWFSLESVAVLCCGDSRTVIQAKLVRLLREHRVPESTALEMWRLTRLVL